jgi:hypothetical protein
MDLPLITPPAAPVAVGATVTGEAFAALLAGLSGADSTPVAPAPAEPAASAVALADVAVMPLMVEWEQAPSDLAEDASPEGPRASEAPMPVPIILPVTLSAPAAPASALEAPPAAMRADGAPRVTTPSSRGSAAPTTEDTATPRPGSPPPVIASAPDARVAAAPSAAAR